MACIRFSNVKGTGIPLIIGTGPTIEVPEQGTDSVIDDDGSARCARLPCPVSLPCLSFAAQWHSSERQNSYRKLRRASLMERSPSSGTIKSSPCAAFVSKFAANVLGKSLNEAKVTLEQVGIPESSLDEVALRPMEPATPASFRERSARAKCRAWRNRKECDLFSPTAFLSFARPLQLAWPSWLIRSRHSGRKRSSRISSEPGPEPGNH